MNRILFFVMVLSSMALHGGNMLPFQETEYGIECQGLIYNGTQKESLKLSLNYTQYILKDAIYLNENGNPTKKNLNAALKNTMQLFCDAEKYGDSIVHFRGGTSRCEPYQPITQKQYTRALQAAHNSTILATEELTLHQRNLEMLHACIKTRVAKGGSDERWDSNGASGLVATQTAINIIAHKIASRSTSPAVLPFSLSTHSSTTVTIHQLPEELMYEETTRGIECQGSIYNGVQKDFLKEQFDTVKYYVQNGTTYQNEAVRKQVLKETLKKTMDLFCQAERDGDSVEWQSEVLHQNSEKLHKEGLYIKKSNKIEELTIKLVDDPSKKDHKEISAFAWCPIL